MEAAISIHDVGEFGLIARVTARLTQGPAVLLGPGDDAAVIRAPDGRVVVTTDLLIEGRHFRRDWSSAYDVGRKAAAQNLADVAAMGAAPTALLVGLGAPPDLPLSWAEELTDGLRDECDVVGASVVGGDVVRAEAVVLGISALGDLESRAPVTRSGARPGDVLAVFGRLGHAAAGVALLRAGLRRPGELVAAHRRPRPPYEAGPAAARLGATAMIDVSDGLRQDLHHVAVASRVRVELDEPLPVPSILIEAAQALARVGVTVDPQDWVMTGGDDHALVAAFPPGVALPPGWVVIGRVRPFDPTEEPPPAGGWDHFRDPPP